MVDLDAPYKLCAYLRMLPNIKNQSVNNQQDIKFCNDLAIFSYQNQLIGKHFINDFNRNDFQNMIDIVINHNKHSTTNYNKYDYNWIWKIISKHKNDNDNDKENKNNDKLLWINNSWTKLEIYLEEKNKNDNNKIYDDGDGEDDFYDLKEIESDLKEIEIDININNEKKKKKKKKKKNKNKSHQQQSIPRNNDYVNGHLNEYGKDNDAYCGCGIF